MPNHRKLAAIAGALYLLTFITSIPALGLKQPFLQGEGTVLAAQAAALLEILLAFACVGTAVALYPVGRKLAPALALGFVASRVLEASLILLGVIALLSLTTVHTTPGGESAATVLVAVHDWAFLIGPGLLPAVNALLLGSLLYRHRLIPRVIPVIGLIGAPLLIASGLGTLLGMVDQVSVVAGLAAAPIAAWEFLVGCWLLGKGFNPSIGQHGDASPAAGARPPARPPRAPSQTREDTGARS